MADGDSSPIVRRAISAALRGWRILTESNGTWGTATNPVSGAVVITISCASAGNCSAGGSSGRGAFVVNETNGTWGRPTNLPSYAAVVTTISCASAGNCSAGGGYGTDTTEAFVVSETDGTWGTPARVRGLNTNSSGLASMSCPAAGNCAAGGEYTKSGKTQAFVVSESGG